MNISLTSTDDSAREYLRDTDAATAADPDDLAADLFWDYVRMPGRDRRSWWREATDHERDMVASFAQSVWTALMARGAAS